MKKSLLLFFALLLPIIIYVFLKFFGKNEFNVPVLFADSVTVSIPCQAYSYPVPYHIPDSVLRKFSWNTHDSLTIVVFDDENTTSQHERKIAINRVFDQFKTEPLQVIRVYHTPPLAQSDSDSRLERVQLEEETFHRIRNCIFLLSSEHDAVIVDSKKRIRGQYSLTKRDDADRMIMQEMNILFKRY